jgi:hypothetical protein
MSSNAEVPLSGLAALQDDSGPAPMEICSEPSAVGSSMQAQQAAAVVAPPSTAAAAAAGSLATTAGAPAAVPGSQAAPGGTSGLAAAHEPEHAPFGQAPGGS